MISTLHQSIELGCSFTKMPSLFAGIYYQHDEEYLNPQTNGSWSGLWVFNEVDNGTFDEMPVSMSYLRGKYGANS